MQKLNETYLKMKQVLGENMEPLESVQLVETYRRYLKPEKVRVLLLAESHVFTSDEDRLIIIPPHTDLPDYPTQYARFVYCLGYGEQILIQNQLFPKNTGTPPFWKILFSCNNPISSLKDFSTILGQTSQQKVSNKIKLLKDLKEKGIWLVDTSIVALYKEGAKDPEEPLGSRGAFGVKPTRGAFGVRSLWGHRSLWGQTYRSLWGQTYTIDKTAT